MGRPLFEAVPDDVDIIKLTIGQRDALSRHRRHENINTFLGNENTPIVIGGFIAGFLGVRLAESIITDLESRVGKLSEDVKQGIKDTIDIKLPTFGAPAPVTPTVSDLITYIKKEIG